MAKIRLPSLAFPSYLRREAERGDGTAAGALWVSSTFGGQRPEPCRPYCAPSYQAGAACRTLTARPWRRVSPAVAGPSGFIESFLELFATSVPAVSIAGGAVPSPGWCRSKSSISLASRNHRAHGSRRHAPCIGQNAPRRSTPLHGYSRLYPLTKCLESLGSRWRSRSVRDCATPAALAAGSPSRVLGRTPTPAPPCAPAPARTPHRRVSSCRGCR